MSDDERAQLVYVRYEDFLRADPRREGNALELGADWRDGDDRYRLCWYEQTNELTLERLSDEEPLDLEDFHRGIAGPVEILPGVRDRAQLEALLGPWPQASAGEQRDVRRLRELVEHQVTVTSQGRRSPG